MEHEKSYLGISQPWLQTASCIATKRLLFGISSAPERYQKIIRDVIRDLPGVVNAADNILVHGRTIAEHDERLIRLLERLQAVNLTVNGDKCEIGQRSIELYGLRRTDDGIKTIPLPNGLREQLAADLL